MPGPDYDVKQKWDKGVLIGRERRLQIAGQKSLAPGPGAYSHLSNFDSPTKGFYMGQRYPDRDKENFPGPGSYSYQSKFSLS